MDTSDLAFLTAQAQTMTGRGSKSKRLKAVDDAVASMGWQSVRNGSNREMTTFQRIDDPSIKHIAHRGTDTKDKKTWQDLGADASILFGNASHNKEFKHRTNRTKKIINANPQSQFSLSGHSYGGGSINYAMANNSTIRNRVDQADTFNAGHAPAFSNDLHVGKDAKKILDKKVTHHRVAGDVVSMTLPNSIQFGQVNEIKQKDPPKTSFSASLVATGISAISNQLAIHGLDNWF